MKVHHYACHFTWTGNIGEGTKKYDSYKRDYEISLDGKSNILGSSDPAFLGDPKRYNPEELFLSSISSCHALWYLHLCSQHGIVVEAYEDNAKGEMEELKDGSGRFSKIVLHPKVTIRQSENKVLSQSLHYEANKMCFIANSLNVKVTHEATIKILSK